MMSRTSKMVLIFSGVLAAIFLIAQLFVGLMIHGGRPDLVPAHYHSGLLGVLLTLVYIAVSIALLLSQTSPASTETHSGKSTLDR
jgi:hypothetical protein